MDRPAGNNDFPLQGSGGCQTIPCLREPPALIEALRRDAAIAEAYTLLLTVPNQLGVAYNAHVIDAVLTHIAPALDWR